MPRKKLKQDETVTVAARVPNGLRPEHGPILLSGDPKLIEKLRNVGGDVRPYNPFLGES
jgi:hypothetical protein